MNEGRIAARYAKALYETALEHNRLTEILEGVTAFLKIWTTEADLRDLLLHPVLQKSVKIRVTQKVIGPQIAPECTLLIELLIKNNRELFLERTFRHYIALASQLSGEKNARLVTAIAPSNTLIEKIQQLLEQSLKARVTLTSTVDSSLIGGYILRVDDQQIDTSVQSALRKVEKGLLQTEL